VAIRVNLARKLPRPAWWAGKILSMTQVTVVPVDPENPTALYRRDWDQPQPRGCVAELDLATGSFTAGTTLVIDGVVPARVRQGLQRWWPMPCLTAAAANRTLEMLAPLAQRVLDGARFQRDDAGETRVLDEDAQAAEAAIIERLAGEFPVQDIVIGMGAEEWFGEDSTPSGVTADLTDAQLVELAAQHDRDVAAGLYRRYAGEPVDDYVSRHIVLHGTEEYFRAHRERLRDKDRKALIALTKRIAKLTEQSDEEVRRQARWGDTHRDIGDRIQRSHTTVANIIAKGPMQRRFAEAIARMREVPGLLQNQEYVTKLLAGTDVGAPSRLGAHARAELEEGFARLRLGRAGKLTSETDLVAFIEQLGDALERAATDPPRRAGAGGAEDDAHARPE
jgi:hypothetical protein